MAVEAGAAWKPSPDGVNQIRTLLTEYRNPSANQAQIFSQHRVCERLPDFCNYLSFIFSEVAGPAFTSASCLTKGLCPECE